MTGSTSEYHQPEAPTPKTQRLRYAVLGAVCALVVSVYAWSARSGWLEIAAVSAGNTYYNLLVQGIRAGHLSLSKEVPSGLSQLADPYDPAANDPYRSFNGLHDLSYYKGRLYLYFGVSPALLVFLPCHELTGHYLLHRNAVWLFCAVGFLSGAGLLVAVWRRYFAEVGILILGACTLAVGMAAGTSLLLARADVYEVAISCGYAFTTVTLLMIWRALHESRRAAWWLAGASLAYGLTLGARPSLLFGGVILLLPVAKAWREKRRIWPLLLAATVPLVLLGVGLVLYNALRFDDPLEFGQRYQLNGDRASAVHQFGPGYLWFNFRIGFLEPARWSGHFPFVQNIALPPLPAGGYVEQVPFGVLTNVPLVWLVLAAPLALRGRLTLLPVSLRWYVVAVALFLGSTTLILCLHNTMALRYQVEVLSGLCLLAAMGILGLERALTASPAWRRAARAGWGLLLASSVAFNLLTSVTCHAQAWNRLGCDLFRQGRVDEAEAQFEEALSLQPDFATAHNNLGIALVQQGKVAEGIGHFKQAISVEPDNGQAHYKLGVALLREGKVKEAIGSYERALRLKPDDAEVQNRLAWELATCADAKVRNGARAVALAESANQRAGGKDPAVLDTLAAAYAEVGRFGDAVRTAQAALELTKAREQAELGRVIQERLELYQAGRPYHQE